MEAAKSHIIEVITVKMRVKLSDLKLIIFYDVVLHREEELGPIKEQMHIKDDQSVKWKMDRRTIRCIIKSDISRNRQASEERPVWTARVTYYSR